MDVVEPVVWLAESSKGCSVVPGNLRALAGFAVAGPGEGVSADTEPDKLVGQRAGGSAASRVGKSVDDFESQASKRSW